MAAAVANMRPELFRAMLLLVRSGGDTAPVTMKQLHTQQHLDVHTLHLCAWLRFFPSLCLFAQVPFIDVLGDMMDETLHLTPFEYEDWGDPRDEAMARFMASYSPYDGVRTQQYPSMLAVGALPAP